MQDWVRRALARWPDVPALFGWLSLDRRGRWLIRGELITRPQIIDTIAANYAADAQGRWYFQNGPQRGYMQLEYAPLVLHAQPDGRLVAHTGAIAERPRSASLDQDGALTLLTEHGPAVLTDADLDWALQRLQTPQGDLDEAALDAALALPGGSPTSLRLRWGDSALPVRRVDAADLPAVLGFVRDPQPLPGERHSGTAAPA